MDFIIKRILKTFLTVLLTAAILVGIIFGFAKIWEKIKDKADTVPTETETSDTTDSTEDEAPDETDDETPVKVITPAESTGVKIPENSGSKASSFSKTGLIVADQNVEVYSEISALISDIQVKEGDTVKAGQTLANLGSSTQVELAKSSYKHAIEALNLAEKSLQITQASGQVSQSTFDNQITSAKLGLQQAVNQLEQGRIVRYQQEALKYYQTEQESNNSTPETTQDSSGDEPITNNQTVNSNTDSDLQDQIDYLQSQIKTTELVGQEQQGRFSIESAQNQLNLIIKQLDSTKLQGQAQEVSALSQINQIRQQLESAQINLASTKIISPINGVVTIINQKPGERVSPNSPIITVTNFDTVLIKASVTPSELFRIDPNNELTITVLNTEVAGQIVSTSPIADPQTKTITIKVAPKGTVDVPLIPNTFAKVNFNRSIAQSQNNSAPNQGNLGDFRLPISIIRFQDNSASVPVVTNGRIKYKKVELGPIINGHAAILNGLNYDDQVVFTPRFPKENSLAQIIQK